MLIIKPYGRSLTERQQENVARRRMTLRMPESAVRDISQLAAETPELLLAHWISMIDKIITKPKPNGKASPDQRRLRAGLAKAAWDKLSATRLTADAKEKLHPIWEWKIHPYPASDEKRKNEKTDYLKGRWYVRFAGGADPAKLTDADFKRIAGMIDGHLNELELRKGPSSKPKRASRIAAQAESIARNVHGEREPASREWTDADWTAFFAAGDVAAEIHATAKQETDNKSKQRPNAKPTLSRTHAGKALYAHYAKLFVENGAVLSIDEAKTKQTGLLALHTAIKAAYKSILDRKKVELKHLPRDKVELQTRMGQQAQNRTLAELVRLGKVIHYEASDGATGDSPKNVMSYWPTADTIKNSRFWLSDGQTEIKRNEALVRVWKAVITLASQTLADWSGGTIEIDILLAIAEATVTTFNKTAYEEKCSLLFGVRRDLFNAGDEQAHREILKAALEGWAQLRHNSFHFMGRQGFVDALQTQAGQLPAAGSVVEKAIAELWKLDKAGRVSRLIATLRGVHADYFFDQDQLDQLAGLVLPMPEERLPIPRFNRVPVRAAKVWPRATAHRGDGDVDLGLPAPGKRKELLVPARQCQYTALKLAYERAFPQWMEAQTAATLNRWIKAAVDRATKASKINSNLAQARMAVFGLLADEEKLGDFLDRITAETASEYRVQRGYGHDAEKAQEQAEHLEELRCDVFAQGFAAWLAEQKLDWLCKLDPAAAPPAEPTSDLEKIAPPLEPADADSSQGAWQRHFYFLLHMVPVEDVSKLLHQLRKWQVLETNAKATNATTQKIVKQAQYVLALYLDMHDASQDGGTQISVDAAFRNLFEQPADFDQLFHNLTDLRTDKFVPVRGLREMQRFGVLKVLLPVLKSRKISHSDVEKLAALEAGESKSPIAIAQEARESLHALWVEEENILSDNNKKKYEAALETVTQHRHLAAHVRLVNAVRLFRLVQQVLARLADYAGLWERDMYFVSLALVHQKGEQIGAVFSKAGKHGNYLASGQIVEAVRESTLKADIEKLFGAGFLDNDGTVKIRNTLAHFNMLRKTEPLDLTRLVTDTRALMAYDRKLKNAVSVSIKELLEREGLDLSWRMENHKLEKAQIKSRQATHLGTTCIKEALHGEDFVRMVADVFASSPAAANPSPAPPERTTKSQQKNHQNQGRFRRRARNSGRQNP